MTKKQIYLKNLFFELGLHLLGFLENNTIEKSRSNEIWLPLKVHHQKPQSKTSNLIYWFIKLANNWESNRCLKKEYVFALTKIATLHNTCNLLRPLNYLFIVQFYKPIYQITRLAWNWNLPQKNLRKKNG